MHPYFSDVLTPSTSYVLNTTLFLHHRLPFLSPTLNILVTRRIHLLVRKDLEEMFDATEIKPTFPDTCLAISSCHDKGLGRDV